MMAVAKIESDFDPKQCTGSYIGLFQLTADPSSENMDPEMITSPRDNAVAAAYKLKPLRRCSLNSMLIKCRLSAICI